MRRERYETSKKLAQSELLSSESPPTGMSSVPLNYTKTTPCSTYRTVDGTPGSRRDRADNLGLQSPASERSFGSSDSRGKNFEYAVQKATAL